jgi:hypothetical protein
VVFVGPFSFHWRVVWKTPLFAGHSRRLGFTIPFYLLRIWPLVIGFDPLWRPRDGWIVRG